MPQNQLLRPRNRLAQVAALWVCFRFFARDQIAASVADLNASRGLLFSTQGFQTGAITLAKHSGIALYNIRELEAAELFGPSSTLDMYRNWVWRSLRNLTFPEIHSWERDLSSSTIHISLGGERPSTNVLTNSSAFGSRTLEGVIESWSSDAAKSLAYHARELLFDGAGGVRRFWKRIRHSPDVPLQVVVDGSTAVIPKLEYDLGITLWQEHEETPSDQYAFVLAVEDCVQGIVRKALRTREQNETVFSPTANQLPPPNRDQLSFTQRILLMPEWLPFAFDEMNKGKYYDTSGRPDFLPSDPSSKNQA